MDAILVYKDGAYARRFPIEGKEVLLGRGGTLVLDSPEVSRRHAVLTRGPQGYFLKDVGSGEGTRLNGEVIPANVEKLIFSGDQVAIGTFTLRLIFAASEDELAAAERGPLPSSAAIEGLAGTIGRMPAAAPRPPPPPAAPPPAPPPPPAPHPAHLPPTAPGGQRAISIPPPPPPGGVFGISGAPTHAPPPVPAAAPAPPPPPLRPPPPPPPSAPAPPPAPVASPPPPPRTPPTGTVQLPSRGQLAAFVPQASLAAAPPSAGVPAAAAPPSTPVIGLGPMAPTARRTPQTGTTPQMRAYKEPAPPGPAQPPQTPQVATPAVAGPVATPTGTGPVPRLQAPSLRTQTEIEEAAARGATIPVPAMRGRGAGGGAAPQQLFLDTLNFGIDKREGKGVLPEGAETLTIEQWLAFDIFGDIPKDRVRKHLERYEDQHPIWVRRYKRGACIVREGEYGSTAYFILHGNVEVFIAARMGIKAPGAAERKEEGGGLLRRLASLVGGGGGKRGGEPAGFRPGVIPIDATVDLDMAKPVATLVEGDIFGEMTCMNFYPRSATVRAATDDVVCFEMLRSVLVDLLQRNSKRFKDKLEQAYRLRALDGHLRSVPIFSDLPQSFIDDLRHKVELVGPLEPGEVICKEGDAADAFYLVRLGFVKVAQQHPGGELVLAYLGRGQYFGEIGLLEGKARMATCSALDRVELVKIKKDEFDVLVSRNPDIKTKLIVGSAERKDAVRALAERTASTAVHLDDFIAQGLINAQNVLLIDLEKCTRCDECVRACAEAHDGVSRLIRDGLRFDKYLVTSSCRACTDPVCMVGCPVGSIRRRGSLEIVIEDWCIGCGKCSNQCPYGNINMVEFPAYEELPSGKKLPLLDPEGKAKTRTQATTCDLSHGLSEPACVYACPHDAAMRVEPRKFFGL